MESVAADASFLYRKKYTGRVLDVTGRGEKGPVRAGFAGRIF